MNPLPLLLRALVVVALIAGCSSESSSPEAPADVGVADASCTAGETRACSCPDGVSSIETCGSEGFGACACEATDAAVPDSPTVDTGPITPCGDVPEGGKCVDASHVAFCSAPTGSVDPELTTTTCKPYEECVATVDRARCALKPGACTPGSTQCSAAGVQSCSSAGAWVTTACPAGCITTAAGSGCTGTGATLLYSGTLSYNFRVAGATGWVDAPNYATPSDVLIVSYDGGKVFDQTTTDGDGKFTVKIPTPVTATTRIRAWLLRKRADGSVAFGIARPGFTTDGVHIPSDTDGVADTSRFMNGEWDPVARPSGSRINFGFDGGGGLYRVYDYVRYAHMQTEKLTGKRGKSLVVWMQPNVSWNCGACYNGSRKGRVGSTEFDAQMWLPMIAGDEGYWSGATTSHEAGHWAMDSFGRSPNEGGAHYAHCTTMPGQAWSEGWATAYSSLLRNESRYANKRSGVFYWFDVADRTASTKKWPLPTPSGGVLQPMAENEVAGMLWRLSKPVVGPTRLEATNVRYLNALVSPRMTTAPFGRGYFRHTWGAVTNACTREAIVKTTTSAPMFADFLDALICSGSATAAEVEGVTQPASLYPYRAAERKCL